MSHGRELPAHEVPGMCNRGRPFGWAIKGSSGGLTGGRCAKPSYCLPSHSENAGSGPAGIPLLASRQWLAVIGAVGQPRDGDPAACYALLHDEQGTLTYLRVPYDALAERSTGGPCSGVSRHSAHRQPLLMKVSSHCRQAHRAVMH